MVMKKMKFISNICHKHRLSMVTAVLLTIVTALNVHAGQHITNNTTSNEVKDAWLDGKLETSYLLNRHLNSFEIDTSVSNSVATISGTVESEIDKSLAEEIAKSVSGITSVNNRIIVDSADTKRKATDAAGSRSFGQYVDDATTTATIKSKLLANSSTSGLSVDVDTNRDVVTLTGTVKSNQEKDLVEQIARNVRYVTDVENQLHVAPTG